MFILYLLCSNINSALSISTPNLFAWLPIDSFYCNTALTDSQSCCSSTGYVSMELTVTWIWSILPLIVCRASSKSCWPSCIVYVSRRFPLRIFQSVTCCRRIDSVACIKKKYVAIYSPERRERRAICVRAIERVEKNVTTNRWDVCRISRFFVVGRLWRWRGRMWGLCLW